VALGVINYLHEYVTGASGDNHARALFSALNLLAQTVVATATGG
jgi:hypothetical protein